MTNGFLQIPLQADLITRQKQLKRCSLSESVSEFDSFDYHDTLW